MLPLRFALLGSHSGSRSLGLPSSSPSAVLRRPRFFVLLGLLSLSVFQLRSPILLHSPFLLHAACPPRPQLWEGTSFAKEERSPSTVAVQTSRRMVLSYAGVKTRENAGFPGLPNLEFGHRRISPNGFVVGDKPSGAQLENCISFKFRTGGLRQSLRGSQL